MPAFVIRGRVYDQPVAASWNDGAVSLSEPLQAAVDWLVRSTSVVEATPTGPAYVPGLDSWERAYVTIRAAFEAADGRIRREEGDLPSWPVAAGDRA